MTNIKRININLAYKEILVFDTDGSKVYPNSNVSECDINPWHTLDVHRIAEKSEQYKIKFPYHLRDDDTNEIRHFLGELNSHNFQNVLDDAFGNFTMHSLDEMLEANEKFIYPIVIYNNDLFVKYNTIELPKEVVESVRSKKARICLIQATEGFFGKKSDNIIWLSNLSKKYSFEKDDLIMITSNLKADEKYDFLVTENIIPDNVTIFPYSYFQHKLWFAGNSNLHPEVREEVKVTFNGFMDSNKKNPKRHHFLAFSRVPKEHRLALFGEMKSNPKLKGKGIATLGATSTGNPTTHYDMVGTVLDDNYPRKSQITEFFKTYDSTKHHTYDELDLENNKASSFNVAAHKDTFVNIITESLFGPDAIFFSEKTYKPMLACQPFIMLGNPHSLKKLKEQGFKTFDKWWDESYDNEMNFSKRFEMIIDIMEEIASWDMDKCFQVTNEMLEVLEHNFNNMLETTETEKLYDFLKTNVLPVAMDPTNEVVNVDNPVVGKVLGVCGDELVDTFPGLLVQKLNWNLISLARHGIDNVAVRLQIDEIIKSNPDYVIIGIAPTKWEKLKDTWIIAEGLRKLMEHGIEFSCVHSRHLFRNDLYFAEHSLVPDNVGLEPSEFLRNNFITPNDQELMAVNWREYLTNNVEGFEKSKPKKRLI